MGAAIACEFPCRDLWEAALRTALLFEALTLPSEVFALMVQQVAFPTPRDTGSARFRASATHAAELGTANKTGKMHRTVARDQDHWQWLVPYVNELTRGRPPLAKLFSSSCPGLASAFRAAAECTGASVLVPTWYCSRRSGDSHDERRGVQDLRAALSRGHWRAWSSVLRCERHGRIGMQL